MKSKLFSNFKHTLNTIKLSIFYVIKKLASGSAIFSVTFSNNFFQEDQKHSAGIIEYISIKKDVL